MLGDTIAAVSTPRGKGGVALLRVSGADALAVGARIFTPKSGKKIADSPPRTQIYGTISDPDGNAIDDGMLTFFRAPNSFTGEDTVEICCHGGILLTETVLTALFAAGARPAEAGEFTRRAFLNGKIGLSSAESLGNLLEAKTGEQIRLAHAGTRGAVEGRASAIYDRLREILASIYVRIDYPDEDLADLTRDEMIAAFSACRDDLAALADTYRTGHAIAEGIPTVICGKPNVGKSSLYNRLVGKDAAIVTSVEGTTRDILCETVALGKVTLRLFDTAGLHETTDPVEKIGVERARNALSDAELILAVFDGSDRPDETDLALIDELKRAPVPVIVLLNKSDLGEGKTPDELANFAHTLRISAESGAGIAELTDLVGSLFLAGEIDTEDDAILTNARQHSAVLVARDAVARAVEGLARGSEIDLCCTDIESAMSSLSELDGRAVTEDVVSQIFSHFCVGK